MTGFLSTLHVMHVAMLRRHEPASAPAENHAKRLTLLLVLFPALVAMIVILFPLGLLPDDIRTPAVFIVALPGVFAVGWYTDRVFDVRRSAIVNSAVEIRDDPARGRRWAARRVIRTWLIVYGSTAVALVAVRWLLIEIGGVYGPLIQTG